MKLVKRHLIEQEVDPKWTVNEKVPTAIFDTMEQASLAVAEEIAKQIRKKQSKDKPFVLGLPVGSAPIGVFEELIRMHKEEGLSFKNVVTFNNIEYYPIESVSIQSYVRFMNENFFEFINIPKENINVLDGTIPSNKIERYCEAYDEKIRSYGGADIHLVTVGGTGHIGFNEPGSGKDSKTRLIALDHITRIEAASDFFGEDNVPRHGIAIGLGTILEAKRIYLLAWGEGKAGIIHKTVEEAENDAIPASHLQSHPNATIIIDEAAGSELTREATPWLLHECDWDDFMIRKGVVWLCQKVKKPILKLTSRDYNDNGMSDLLVQKGSSYSINIKVFNELQRTITGWPGGKPNADDTSRPERKSPFPKRVIIFSPHPDDDVISMGGTFIRLVDQGHDVHVAYQTSGNIAVFDDDALRFADFASQYSKAFAGDFKKIKDIEKDVIQFIRKKKPGQVDCDAVKEIKGLIRRAEATAGCRFVGIPDKNIHFLDMPFYETGKVKKEPLGEDDIQIVMDLIREVKPHQIYAAGDLSDPHGTHRVCLEAIFRAVDRLKDEEWMKDCWVWLYRGAWHEWEVEKVEMAVPLSPNELQRKMKAIFKHQSQKDAALFPGTDPREFWQRAKDRNQGTAKLYDELGMAEYEAIEAFVQYKYREI
jgi:glucosamine-6-phosphate deaminase